jgi:hypothetical protein
MREGLRVAVAVVVIAGMSAASADRAAAQTAAPIVVAAGGNLQAALDQAQPGQTIELQAGATFDGNFVLPAKAGTGVITVRTSASDAQLPTGTRVGPAQAPLLPTLRSINTMPALRTAAGAKNWRLIGLRFTSPGGGDLASLGDGAERDRTRVPSGIVLDRVIVSGNLTAGQKRGIALNSADTQIVNSHITGIRLAGQESQAIAGWNGPGPYLIENNYIEAGAIGILFGGAVPAIDQLVPGDITIRRNQITRPVAWRGGTWMVKNLLELKNARDVLIEGNVIENNWAADQAGFAVVLTPRASGTAPWTVIERVRFENNLVRHSGSALNVLGYDGTATTRQLHDLVIRNNEFTDIDGGAWGGGGIFLQMGDEAADVHVEHNTVMHTGHVVSVYGGTPAAPRVSTGFRFTGNIAKHNAYGIYGNGVGTGNPGIAKYLPASVVTGNVLAGGNASLYPTGNVFPTIAELMAQFVNAAAGDYRLIPTSTLRALPQGVPGVDVDELQRVMAGQTGGAPSAPTGLRITN